MTGVQTCALPICFPVTIRPCEKYGPINFSQELILLTDNRKDAEELEKELANSDWTSNIDYANFPVLNNLLKARLIVYENTEPKQI